MVVNLEDLTKEELASFSKVLKCFLNQLDNHYPEELTDRFLRECSNLLLYNWCHFSTKRSKIVEIVQRVFWEVFDDCVRITKENAEDIYIKIGLTPGSTTIDSRIPRRVIPTLINKLQKYIETDGENCKGE